MTAHRAWLAAALLALPASLPAQQAEDGSKELLSEERIAALPARAREEWGAYIARSRRMHALDSASMAAELRTAGLAKMTKATYAGPTFDEQVEKKGDLWVTGDSARIIADAVVTFQTPSGGWSKRTDMTRARQLGQSYYSETDAWHYIPTLDNGATTGQLRYLSRVQKVWPDRRYAEAVDRGVQFLLAAQQPNGCWPQDFPLDGGYHDAVTFNDDAVVNVLEVLDAAAAGTLGALSPARRDSARVAAQRGVSCIVAAQVRVKGKPAIWGQQHDPLTLRVVPARRYELAGLAGRESAGLLTYLMTLPEPGVPVQEAIRGAAAWFRAHAITDHAYDVKTGLAKQAGAGPIWARLTEIGTGRPIFSNRDGVKLYDWNLLTDRRTGYAWYGTEPGSALKKFEKWAKAHPRTR